MKEETKNEIKGNKANRLSLERNKQSRRWKSKAKRAFEIKANRDD